MISRLEERVGTRLFDRMSITFVRRWASRADTFLRYYEFPGYGHAISTVFNASWDSLTTLENWVEWGTLPTNQIVTDTMEVPGRPRPLCDYPAYPRYNGSGYVNAASSFSCSTQ